MDAAGHSCTAIVTSWFQVRDGRGQQPTVGRQEHANRWFFIIFCDKVVEKIEGLYVQITNANSAHGHDGNEEEPAGNVNEMGRHTGASE
jgi:hypothetical protein